MEVPQRGLGYGVHRAVTPGSHHHRHRPSTELPHQRLGMLRVLRRKDPKVKAEFSGNFLDLSFPFPGFPAPRVGIQNDRYFGHDGRMLPGSASKDHLEGAGMDAHGKLRRAGKEFAVHVHAQGPIGADLRPLHQSRAHAL